MGVLDGLMGNASKVDPASIKAEYAQVLASGEAIDYAYKLVRDLFLFTSHRLILVNVQGMTGKKVEYLSIPYKSIARFAVETAGTFDLDAELKIWTSGAEPIGVQFNKQVNIYEVQGLLAAYICR